VEREGELAARADEDEIRRARAARGARRRRRALPERVGAARDVRGPGDRIGAAAVEDRELLPREDERRRAVAALDGDLPRPRGLLRIAGAEDDEVRDRAQRGHVLDRLVRRAVLAEEDRVVRED